MIQVHNLTQSYSRNGHKKTLKNIDLSIREQAVTALIGANGAGKSTLLGVMSNLLPALSGSVTLHGKDIRHIKPSDLARHIAVLKQTHHTGIRLTVQDLVEFGRFPHCGGRPGETDLAKIHEALLYMELEELRHRYLDELSGGQRQRAFIAMILAQDTPYIFLDEPLNNLDIKYSVEMMKIIRRLVEELHKTIIIVLHDINFASAYADHIVAMKDGCILREGPPATMMTKEVVDHIYEHDFNIAQVEGKSVCLYFN